MFNNLFNTIKEVKSNECVLNYFEQIDINTILYKPQILPFYFIPPTELKNIKTLMYQKSIVKITPFIYRFCYNNDKNVMIKIKDIYNVKTNKRCRIYRINDNIVDFYDDEDNQIINSEISEGFNQDNKLLYNYIINFYQTDKRTYLKQKTFPVENEKYFKTIFETPYDKGFFYIDLDLNYNEIKDMNLFNIYVIKHDGNNFIVTNFSGDELYRFNIDNDFETSFEFDNINVYIKMNTNDDFTLKTLKEPFQIQFLLYNSKSKTIGYPYLP